MFKDKKFEASPSRTYVAICNKTNFDGHYFRKFVLPKSLPVEGRQFGDDWIEGSYTPINVNTCDRAAWYFLNILNFEACIECCIPWEQYINIKDQDEINCKHQEEMKRMFPPQECRS